MAQGGGDCPHVLPVVDQQRGVQVPELVDTVKRQLLFFAKGTEPLVGLIQAHGGAVGPGEQAAALLPLIAQCKALSGLFHPQLLHKVEDPRRELQRAAALDRLGGRCHRAGRRGVNRRPPD